MNPFFYKKIALFTGNCLFLPLLLFAQTPSDTLLHLPAVEISAEQIRQQPVGGIIQTWNSPQLQNTPSSNIADLLSAQTGTYIKSYGLGSLATSSVRGGSAGHTLVLWNGLPIQSPMLGLLDLSLLPVHFSESIHFEKGGNAVLWGSGAVAGTVSMENKANFQKKTFLQSESRVGSFGQWSQFVQAKLGNKKWQSTTRFRHQQADNDFHYLLVDGLPKRQQSNAALSQQSFQQDFYWKPSAKGQLALHYWRQQSDREIPPTNVQTRSEASQIDQSDRIMLAFRQALQKGFLNIKTGFFKEHLDYFDPPIQLESRSQFRTWLGDWTWQWQQQQHFFLLGNTHSYTRAWSDGYPESIPEEYRTALFGSWKWNFNNWHYQVNFRQEMVDGQLMPLIASLGFNYQFHTAFSIKGKIGKNYRLPTLNDRYWQPGGNPDLLPESGWSEEITFSFQKTVKNWQVSSSLTAFNRNIDNWILWSRQEGQSFWSANNITKVWSRGLEPRLSILFNKNNWQIHSRLGYDYIRSTNEIALQHPSIAAGEQLAYTPLHQAFGSFWVEWKQLRFGWQHQYTGATQGNNDTIAAFHLDNVRVRYSQSFKKVKTTFFFDLNNVWNTDYQVIERRPMPGRNFQTGMLIVFNQY